MTGRSGHMEVKRGKALAGPGIYKYEALIKKCFYKHLRFVASKLTMASLASTRHLQISAAAVTVTSAPGPH